jgi:hypothetical protein
MCPVGTGERTIEPDPPDAVIVLLTPLNPHIRRGAGQT